MREELATQLATELWRSQKRLRRLAVSSEDQELFESSFGRLFGIITDEGIEIKDQTGERYNDGMTTEVIHFEHDDNLLAGERIITETIKPIVIFEGEIIERGQVIVSQNIIGEENAKTNN